MCLVIDLVFKVTNKKRSVDLQGKRCGVDSNSKGKGYSCSGGLGVGFREELDSYGYGL